MLLVIYESPNKWHSFKVEKEKIDMIRQKLTEQNKYFVFVETNEDS